MAKIFKQISHGVKVPDYPITDRHFLPLDIFLLSFTTNRLNRIQFVKCKQHNRAYNSYQSNGYNHVKVKITEINIRFKLGPIIKSTQNLVALYECLKLQSTST